MSSIEQARTTMGNIRETAEALPDGPTKWENVYGWSSEVPETAHDGHAVEVLAVVDDEPDHPDEAMTHIRVRCELCGVEFDALDGEVVAR